MTTKGPKQKSIWLHLGEKIGQSALNNRYSKQRANNTAVLYNRRRRSAISHPTLISVDICAVHDQLGTYIIGRHDDLRYREVEIIPHDCSHSMTISVAQHTGYLHRLRCNTINGRT